MTLGVRKLKLLGVAAVAILAMGTSGCSSLPSVPDWVDPTTWFGSDEPPAEPGQAPDVASLPNRPASTTPDEQQQTAETLAADRTNAHYSAEALRGGTEPAASPPPDMAPAPPAEQPAAPAHPTQVAAAAPAAPAVDHSISQDPTGSAAAGTLPATPAGTPVTAPAPAPVQTAPLPQPTAPAATHGRRGRHGSRTAAAAPATPAAPAAPAVPATPTAPAAPAAPATPAAPVAPAAPAAPAAPQVATAGLNLTPSDAELGFRPSSAPPLDPTVSQFVAAPIVDHYRRTAASAAVVAQAPAAAPPPARRVHRRAASAPAVGGPTHMEGRVVANLDVLGPPPAPPSVVAGAASGATAVILFPHDGVTLTAEAQAQIRAAVAQYRAAGGQVYVRVVGHSSSRTANMSAAAHIALIFKKSQDRANAVARALIRAGIPADHVLVEAVGDSQPIYYESMPRGEEGNRRAEIFVGG